MARGGRDACIHLTSRPQAWYRETMPGVCSQWHRLTISRWPRRKPSGFGCRDLAFHDERLTHVCRFTRSISPHSNATISA